MTRIAVGGPKQTSQQHRQRETEQLPAARIAIVRIAPNAIHHEAEQFGQLERS